MRITHTLNVVFVTRNELKRAHDDFVAENAQINLAGEAGLLRIFVNFTTMVRYMANPCNGTDRIEYKEEPDGVFYVIFSMGSRETAWCESSKRVIGGRWAQQKPYF